MFFIRIGSFILFFSIALAIIFGIHFFTFRPAIRAFSLQNSWWKWSVVFLSSSYILASVGVRFWYNSLTKWFYVAASIWLGMLFFLFCVSVVYELLYLYTRKDSAILISILFLIVLGVTAYSFINARTLNVEHVSLSVKGLTVPRTVVQLSDIHVGTINNLSYLERIVEKVNAENPDLVLITGDLFDGSAPIVPETLKPLDNLSAKTFFSTGNHEAYEGIEKVRQTMATSSITLLENSIVTQDGIQIIGANDPSVQPKKNLREILGGLVIDENIPSILMYHQPKDWAVGREFGVDLQLSGHTHNGQIFPFNLLVKIPFPNIRGLYVKDGAYLYTSPGTGTWGPPLRFGSRSEITVFHLEPLK